MANITGQDSTPPTLEHRAADALNGTMVSLLLLLATGFFLWQFATGLPPARDVLASLDDRQQQVLWRAFGSLTFGLVSLGHLVRMALAAFKRR